MTEKKITFGKKPGGQPTRGEVERRREAAKKVIPVKPNPISDTHPDIVDAYSRPKPQMPTIKRR